MPLYVLSGATRFKGIGATKTCRTAAGPSCKVIEPTGSLLGRRSASFRFVGALMQRLIAVVAWMPWKKWPAAQSAS
jgi:hypothetical protein